MKNKAQFVKDLQAKSIYVSREYNAPVKDVWRAYTESELLDQWWGPAPWRAETKSMNFTPGGYWLYAMVGPEGEKHWARLNYIAINQHKNIEAEDAFCDENGKTNTDLPSIRWNTIFTETGSKTKVEFKLRFASEKDLQTIIDMGFEEGFSQGLDQLETLLGKKVPA